MAGHRRRRGRRKQGEPAPKTGPPPKFTDPGWAENKAELLRLIREGNYFETAAAQVGLSSKTVRDWVRRGARGEEPYEEYSLEIRKAQAEAESLAVSRVVDAEVTDWRAAAWRLERQHAKRWGQQIKVTTDRVVDKVLDVAEQALGERFPEALQVLVEKLAELEGEAAFGEVEGAEGDVE